MRKKYKTISITEELYTQIEEIISKTGYRTVTEFILYHTRKAVNKIYQKRNQLEKKGSSLSAKETEEIKKQLRSLGYLE